MQFIDLGTQQQRIRAVVEARIRRVLDHGQYVLGPENEELEERLAAYVGVRHALGCASGTDALVLGLMALGVGPGDAVFTSPFTFVATAEAIALTGAVPVFVDIEPVTFNLAPDRLAQAVEAVRRKDARLHPLPAQALAGEGLHPRGVIAVDLFGVPADYAAIAEVAAAEELFVIEDAAQSFGGMRQGRLAGSFGDLAATSFFPAKPLGGYGDGGMVFTDNDRLAALVRSIRVHGQGEDRYENVRLGLNARLDTLQAAVLLAKCEIFADEVERRQQVAAAYSTRIEGAGLGLVTPQVPEGCRSAWAQYSVLADNRQLYLERLAAAGIPYAIYYPRPLHLQAAFAYLGYPAGALPVAEDVAGRIFSLPMHPYLAEQDIDRVVAALAG
ncbi:MAG TPA: DegT/DnrJ/EryC1/StrS family aminotransferase [Desulfobacterales bacterium]|nr:DegT/DnrJ/EryC1/StrS family aminotransferase [Desulfobacterales bacterium]